MGLGSRQSLSFLFSSSQKTVLGLSISTNSSFIFKNHSVKNKTIRKGFILSIVIYPSLKDIYDILPLAGLGECLVSSQSAGRVPLDMYTGTGSDSE